MGPQEKWVAHTATPLGVSGLGIPRTTEKALLAVGQSLTSDLREKHLRLEEVAHKLESLEPGNN